MRLNYLDRFKIAVNPTAAAAIIQSRSLAAQYSTVNGRRPARRSNQEIRQLEEAAQLPLAQQARYYEENFPIFKAGLDELVKNVIADGIKINPQTRLKNGKPATEVNKQLTLLHKDFSKVFCMNGRDNKTEAESLMFRALMRDGEVFNRIYNFGGHDFLSPVQLGFEPFECDHVPSDLSNEAKNIRSGFALGKYGRVTGIYYNSDPNAFTLTPTRIPISEVMHIANKTRVNGLRGIGQFASCMGTVSDLASVQEASQLALRAATKLTMVHKVGTSSNVDDLGDSAPPPSNIVTGYSNVVEIGAQDDIKVFESSKGVGDTIKAIQDLSRQIVTTGGASFSSTTGIYSGTYSSQRQELIDSWANYLILRAKFIDYVVRPCYEKFVHAVFVQRLINLPADFDINSLFFGEFVGAVMPWIDPKKEAESLEILMRDGLLPLSLALAQRGYDITNILHRYHEDRKLAKSLDLDDLLQLDRKVANANSSKGEDDAEDEKAA